MHTFLSQTKALSISLLAISLAIAFVIKSAAYGADSIQSFPNSWSELKSAALTLVDKNCQQKVDEARQPASLGAAGEFVKYLNVPSVCSCIVSRSGELFDRSMEVATSNEMVGREGQRIAAECLRNQWKLEWKPLCASMIAEVGRLRNRALPPLQLQGEICDCGQRAFEKNSQGASDWKELTAWAVDATHSCYDNKAVYIPGKSAEEIRQKSIPQKSTKILSDGGRMAMKRFGLLGRMSRDCTRTDSNFGWSNYVVPGEGLVVIESYRGGDPPSLTRRQIVLVAEEMEGNLLRMSTEDAFPNPDNLNALVLKRTEDGIRTMQNVLTQGGKTIERVKDGISIITKQELAPFKRCDP